jgi:hypothetical protein
MRINRVGFMERHVLPLFGYFPWKCGSCGSTFRYRAKGIVRKRRHTDRDIDD